MSDTVKVSKIPKCDICGETAYADARMYNGSWANLCVRHLKLFGIGLGTGFGQRYVLDKSERVNEKKGV